ncbi:hypothetical protein CN083_15740 [Sinorhizobium meliloti]|uniref:hypothetical protein n=1 Tax=Rhizobium meliloti TaxID=382 RepID=UPI000FDA958D|nr:hypothetical protein [Sinorhizobium meliloti]RVP07342.1 hypothetical protein CN083_15740 [Sinorhizobium meliloti]
MSNPHPIQIEGGHTMDTLRTPAEAIQRVLCDRVIEACAVTMFQKLDAPVDVIVDRLAAYTFAQLVQIEGKDAAARMLRDIAQQIEDGALDASERGKGN